jgi:DNA invertase Pin-like site-specific DNA recombinase
VEPYHGMTTDQRPDIEDAQYVLPWYPAGVKRAALYARVSSTDHEQDPEAQLLPLREYAARCGFAVVQEYVDRASSTRADLDWFRRLFEAARRRQFDVLLVWRYDRFARSTRELINVLANLYALGIDFISYTDGADTTTPQGKLLFRVMASLAEFERCLIAGQVKAGMQRAKAQGKHTGRPAIPSAKRRRIEELHRADPRRSLRSIAKEVGVAPETVRNRLRALSRETQP